MKIDGEKKPKKSSPEEEELNNPQQKQKNYPEEEELNIPQQKRIFPACWFWKWLKVS